MPGSLIPVVEWPFKENSILVYVLEREYLLLAGRDL